jgi:hypothetical protein
MLDDRKSTVSGLIAFKQGEYIGLRDDDGKVTLSPDLCFTDISAADAGSAFIASHQTGLFIVDKYGKTLTDKPYDRISTANEGCFVVRRGYLYNLLRTDYTEVLHNWVHKIGEVHNGYFIIGNTERRSATSDTRHLYGLAHIDGTVVFAPIFEKLVWRGRNFFYAEKDNHPYIIKEDGSIIDLTFEHLPVRMEVDRKVLVKKALDWILTGMHVYYRDSEAEIDAKHTYTVGNVIRAGFFVDVSTRLQKPQTKLRYLIYSAHAAPWEAVNELVVDNPNIAHWGFCTLHCNSYYIVLDVYAKGGVTQVSLLHIPPAVAKNIGESAQEILDVVKQIPTDKGSLVELAHMLLDRNLKSKYAYNLNDEYLMQCMRHPIGLSQDYQPVSLEPAKLKGDAAALGRLVTRLAKDGDIDNFYTDNPDDNFAWKGLEGSICEGCIYTRGIVDGYKGCGRLTTGSFRRNYRRGQCEYRKQNIAVYSQAEIDAKHRWSKYQDHINKTSPVFAKNLVNKLISEHLGGDINRLADLNFYTLPQNSKYVNHASVITQMPIVKALMSLIFSNAWHGVNYDSIERYEFVCDLLHSTVQQLGAPVGDEYFLGMHNLSPTPQQTTMAFELYNLAATLGNLWLLPNRSKRDTLFDLHHDSYYCGYADLFVHDIITSLTKAKGARPEIAQLIEANAGNFEGYRGVRGAKKFMQQLLLDGFVNEPPRLVATWRYPDEKYFDTLSESHKFYTEAIRRRAARMIALLKQKL